MFEFLFKMFSEGDAAVPAKGMGMISQQLGEGLEKDELILNERIVKLIGNQAYGESGTIYQATTILIATEAVKVPSPYQDQVFLKSKSTVTLYFSTLNKTNFTDRIVLNDNLDQLINNIAFMDHVAPLYAPKNHSLIAVSIREQHKEQETSLEDRVRKELLQ